MRNVFVVALVACGMASASIVTFNGQDVGANGRPLPNSDASAAAFDAAVTGETIFNFEAQPLGSFTTLPLGSGVSVSGVGSSIQNAPVGSPASLFGFNTTVGGSQYLSLESGTGSATFTFTTPVTAFGFYYTGVQLNGETITFNDGSSQTVPIPNPGSGAEFIGFTDFGKTFTSVTINALNDIVGIDDVRMATGAAAVTPEPSTVTLLGLGLAAFGLKKCMSRS